jgi:sugar O-acyltransferase (sialic acid O-acetyltransferase NeuD family)
MKLYGASGHAKVIIDILNAQYIEITEIYDDFAKSTLLNNIPIRKPSMTDEKGIISIGDNAIRKKIVDSKTFNNYGIAIHPSAIISPFAEIGEGTVVMQGAIIQSGAKIGNHCIINTGATVDHDCVIEDFVHISPGVNLCGNVTVGEGTQIGVGALIIPGVKVGSWSLVCAGSVVINDIPSNCVAGGNFCKVKRSK